MKSSSKIAMNTSILYGKMILSTIFALMSTRWVLAALGQEDFGIYNLVAGLIAMFSFLNAAMSVASQRYLSFAIGTKDEALLRRTFYYSVIQHLGIGLAVLILFEFGGVFFLDEILDIPQGRGSDALFVLNCLSISTFLTIITVPYQALANSHENMLIIALIGVMDSVLKFAAALCLLYYAGDRLRLYAMCMVGISFISMLVIRTYCKRRYSESHFNLHKISDRMLFKEFGFFAFWNFFGALAGVIKNQGLAIILNVFYGVIVNAAYGIANQVNGQLSFFANTMVRAIQPQLVQSEGAGNTKKMMEFSIMACKIPALMLSILLIPLIIKMHFVLHVWLGKYPEYSSVFCQIVLVATLIFQSTKGVELSIHAKGNIKMFQIVGYGLQMLIIPIGLLILYLGGKPAAVLSLLIFGNIGNAIAVMYYSHKYAGLDVPLFLRTFFLPFYAVLGSTALLGYLIRNLLSSEFLNFCIVFVACGITLASMAWLLLLNADEKRFILNFISKITKKISKKSSK